MASVCRAVALFLAQRFEPALVELEQAATTRLHDCDPYFWRGMAYAYLGNDEEARTAVDKALALEMPPILLSPLRWLEQDRPAAYKAWVEPLLAQFDLLQPATPADSHAPPPRP